MELANFLLNHPITAGFDTFAQSRRDTSVHNEICAQGQLSQMNLPVGRIINRTFLEHSIATIN